MDRGVCWAIVYKVAESDTTEWLTHRHTHTHIYNLLKAENEFINKEYPSIFHRDFIQYLNNYYTWKKAHSEYFFQIASDLGLFWQYLAYIWKSSFCDKKKMQMY